MDTLLKFGNIQEIKFSRVDGCYNKDIFSISIKSDIEKDGRILKNTVFESKLCVIDSVLELKMRNGEMDLTFNNNFMCRSEVYSIPIDIRLIQGDISKILYTIKT